jgi:LPXTG-motif cell wall-anchored protein
MSYVEIKPQYYQMHQPDSPWHAGSPGWSTAPWPSFDPNPNLVGPPRLAVEGLGAYFKPLYERPIAGLGAFPQRSTYRPKDGMMGLGAYFKPLYERPIAGLGGCGCNQSGMGADAVVDNTVMVPQTGTTNKASAALLIGLGVAVIVGGVIFLGPHRKHGYA